MCFMKHSIIIDEEIYKIKSSGTPKNVEVGDFVNHMLEQTYIVSHANGMEEHYLNQIPY